MKRKELPQNAESQNRSNILKTKLKQQQVAFLAPQTPRTHQNRTGFICFFENHILAKIDPFPAPPNPSRNRFLRRRSNAFKMMVSAQI